MNEQELAKIKEAVQEFFGQTGLAIEVDVKNPVESTVPIDLKADEPQFLIGEGGQTLVEIQRLLKTVLRKSVLVQEPFYIDIDVNDYKKKKTEYLQETARSVADEVSLTKKEKELEPMPPYERRIIHAALSLRIDVATESVGEEPARRVKIKPRASM